MNIIELFEKHKENGNWQEALKVVQLIIEKAPHISTSWFNKGVCLDELGNHNEAAEAFIKAQELDIEDWGIHFRILRSAFLAQNADLFFGFADYSISLNIEILKAIEDEELFRPILQTNNFKALKEKFNS